MQAVVDQILRAISINRQALDCIEVGDTNAGRQQYRLALQLLWQTTVDRANVRVEQANANREGEIQEFSCLYDMYLVRLPAASCTLPSSQAVTNSSPTEGDYNDYAFGTRLDNDMFAVESIPTDSNVSLEPLQVNAPFDFEECFGRVSTDLSATLLFNLALTYHREITISSINNTPANNSACVIKARDLYCLAMQSLLGPAPNGTMLPSIRSLSFVMSRRTMIVSILNNFAHLASYWETDHVRCLDVIRWCSNWIDTLLSIETDPTIPTLSNLLSTDDTIVNFNIRLCRFLTCIQLHSLVYHYTSASAA
jgi:hypothetical protein